jgi:hypothetical protein
MSIKATMIFHPHLLNEDGSLDSRDWHLLPLFRTRSVSIFSLLITFLDIFLGGDLRKLVSPEVCVFVLTHQSFASWAGGEVVKRRVELEQILDVQETWTWTFSFTHLACKM